MRHRKVYKRIVVLVQNNNTNNCRLLTSYNLHHLIYLTPMKAYALQNSIQTATVLITGRLGPDELSAAAFTMMLGTVTGPAPPFPKYLLTHLGLQGGVSP